MTHPLSEKLYRLKNATAAKTVSRFFKTAKGDYGEGDQFLGVKVPILRALIRNQAAIINSLSIQEIERFCLSPWHEERLMGALILVRGYERASAKEKEKWLRGYLKIAKRGGVNNWDLVDQSAPYISGDWMRTKEPNLLDSWIDSPSLWERRIAIVSTLTPIRNREFKKTIEYTVKLMGDREDLLHKACGWMLREMGKKEQTPLRQFLDQYSPQMPRTMLRYAIERFPEAERLSYLKVKLAI